MKQYTIKRHNKILKYSKLTEAAVRKLAKSMGVAVL